MERIFGIITICTLVGSMILVISFISTHGVPSLENLKGKDLIDILMGMGTLGVMFLGIWTFYRTKLYNIASICLRISGTDTCTIYKGGDDFWFHIKNPSLSYNIYDISIKISAHEDMCSYIEDYIDFLSTGEINLIHGRAFINKSNASIKEAVEFQNFIANDGMTNTNGKKQMFILLQYATLPENLGEIRVQKYKVCITEYEEYYHVNNVILLSK